MLKVAVLDTNKNILAPCHPARAKELLDKGKAAVYRRYPFTIILKRAIPKSEIKLPSLRLKIDPGSKTTGLAIINDNTSEVVWAAELQHRGEQIKKLLDSRRAIRRSRRNRKTRYRKPRFNNRKRPKGWLPPSKMSRVINIQTWFFRLRKFYPITDISMELVRFDTQVMQNPDISGVEYQQGELFGYEVREHLLEKFCRKCAYCGKTDVPLQVEHIIPKSRGGSNRVSNLTIACESCNQKKGNKTAEEFGHPEVQKQAKKPLKDAAAINATRWKIYETLKATGLPIEVGTGGMTKYNRVKHGLPKTHWLDAVCVGKSTPVVLKTEGVKPLLIKATGHGNRQMCRMDKYGFPRTKPKQVKRVFMFQTGDIVKAIVTRGKKIGIYVGRVAVRASGREFIINQRFIFFTTSSFNIKTRIGTVQGISYRYCNLLHHADGYGYSF